MGETIRKKIYRGLLLLFVIIFVISLIINFANDSNIYFGEVIESLITSCIVTFFAYIFLRKDLNDSKKIK